MFFILLIGSVTGSGSVVMTICEFRVLCALFQAQTWWRDLTAFKQFAFHIVGKDSLLEIFFNYHIIITIFQGKLHKQFQCLSPN